MNKKGFTLIELLAAISILALLMVIIIPNVTSLYSDAKKNIFVNECRDIYKSARSSYVYDNVRESEPFAYASGVSNSGSVNTLKLDLSGKSYVSYIVQFDEDGNIVYFYVNDGTYEMEQGQINVKGKEILINDIDGVTVIETPYTKPGDKVVDVETPTESGSGDNGGQITPLDPGYDPDDPNNPIDPNDPNNPDNPIRKKAGEVASAVKDAVKESAEDIDIDLEFEKASDLFNERINS
jgi:prepilin-type N-terminal cleavage/methylation domain-containing protein